MCEFQEFFYVSSTGVNTIRAIKCIPSSHPKAIVQIAHGVADHIDRYRDFMCFLAEHGIMSVGNDHLGHGHTIRHPTEQGFFAYTNGWEHAVNDMEKLHDLISVDFPKLPYVLFGHSMGSFLTRTYLIKHPDKYDAAVISGTGHMKKPLVDSGHALADIIVKTKGPRHLSALIDKIAFGSYNKKFSPARTKFDWISRDENQVDKYAADPLCGFIATASLFRDMMDGIKFITNQENINKMNPDKPILLISGDSDPVGEDGVAVERAYKALCQAGLKDVYMKLYPGGRHEMLNETNRKEVYMDIMSWLSNRI